MGKAVYCNVLYIDMRVIQVDATKAVTRNLFQGGGRFSSIPSIIFLVPPFHNNNNRSTTTGCHAGQQREVKTRPMC